MAYAAIVTDCKLRSDGKLQFSALEINDHHSLIIHRAYIHTYIYSELLCEISRE
jgi:hypothetical protein